MTGEPGFPVRERHERFQGPLFRVVTDQVELPGGKLVARDYLRHLGAVAVVPLERTGLTEQVVMVRQYRHPVGGELWELPAGIVDVPGESLPELAARELTEETDLVAHRLDLLVDLHPSPGYSDERIRIFLASGLAPAPDTFRRVDEEATMTVARFTLDDAVQMIFDGQVTNGPAVAGLLAAARARDLDWAPLRPADAPLAGPVIQ